MGREIKRVPLDFDYPLNQVWAGYINPFYTAEDCPHCERSGYAPDAKRLSDQWYGNAEFEPSMTGSEPLTPDTPAVRAFAERNIGHSPGFYGTGESAIIREAQRLCDLWNAQWSHHLDQDDVDALVEDMRLWDFTKNGIEHPTAQQVNEWNILTMGHDSINQYVCVLAKCQRLGYEHRCFHCGGDGELWSSKAAKDLYESWEPVEPPAGKGFQLWETVSEGSPISPVFTDKITFVDYLVSQGYSQSGALAFAESGFAFSGVLSDKGYQNGIDAQGK